MTFLTSYLIRFVFKFSSEANTVIARVAHMPSSLLFRSILGFALCLFRPRRLMYMFHIVSLISILDLSNYNFQQ